MINSNKVLTVKIDKNDKRFIGKSDEEIKSYFYNIKGQEGDLIKKECGWYYCKKSDIKGNINEYNNTIHFKYNEKIIAIANLLEIIKYTNQTKDGYTLALIINCKKKGNGKIHILNENTKLENIKEYENNKIKIKYLNPNDEIIINEMLDELNYIEKRNETYKELLEKTNFFNKQKNLPSFSKYKGNIFAFIIKEYIQKILKNTELDVSDNNVFIKGHTTEWDLLIVRKNSIHKNNIYEAKDVKAIIEFKTSGTPNVDYKNIDDEEDKYRSFFEGIYDNYCEKIKAISNEVNKKEIPFLYISFTYWEDYYKSLKKYFYKKNNNKDTAFVFLNDQIGMKRLINENTDFEKFILNIVK